MYIKKFIFFILYMFVCINANGQQIDTTLDISISNILQKNNENEVKQMDFAFFDKEIKQFYYQINIGNFKQSFPNAFIFIEIKKQSNMQFKFKPFYTKKVELNNFSQKKYIDSVSMQSSYLVSGNYDLIVYLMQDSLKIFRKQKSGFQVLNDIKEKVVDENFDAQNTTTLVNIKSTFVANYDLETLKKNIGALAPISKGVEFKVVQDLSNIGDKEYLQHFFFNFWYNRNASEPEKEWKLYADKLNYVAKQYGTATMPGYQTDRGRIYLQYGEPTKYERVPAEKDALPYEIWVYKFIENKSNIYFLFYQPGNMGSQMFLLNSNFDGEVRNPNWAQTLLMDPNNGDNKLMHRVFEYFKQ